jgi:DNA polymerase
MLVGEQPGNDEDLPAIRFVGPAGKLLDRALASRHRPRAVYVTNVVKHFKWEPRGKRRIHKKPNAAEIARAGRGSTPRSRSSSRARSSASAPPRRRRCSAAVQGDRASRRIRPSPLAPLVLATVHPSSILRAPDDERGAAR